MPPTSLSNPKGMFICLTVLVAWIHAAAIEEIWQPASKSGINSIDNLEPDVIEDDRAFYANVEEVINGTELLVGNFTEPESLSIEHSKNPAQGTTWFSLYPYHHPLCHMHIDGHQEDCYFNCNTCMWTPEEFGYYPYHSVGIGTYGGCSDGHIQLKVCTNDGAYCTVINGLSRGHCYNLPYSGDVETTEHRCTNGEYRYPNNNCAEPSGASGSG